MPGRSAPALASTDRPPVRPRTKTSTPGVREIELKLEVDPGAGPFSATDVVGARGKTVHLVTTYYDTTDADVRRAGCSLRIRREHGARAQTIKGAREPASGLFTRTEWTRPVTGDRPVLDATSGPFGPALRAIGVNRLDPCIVTDFHRIRSLIDRGDGEIEWAIDEGEIRASGHVAPLREIELELKRGSPKILFDVAREIAGRVPVRIAVLSKSQRGYRLLGGSMSTPAHAEPIVLDRDDDAREAFAAIAHSCLRQFRINETLLIESGNVEAVHQARVALRRLRTALWLFRSLFADDPQAEAFEADLRWLTGRLGEVRNVDVIVPHAREAAVQRLQRAREEAMAVLRTDLASTRARATMLDLAEWLAIGAWRIRAPSSGNATESATSFAHEAFRKLRKRLKRRGKGLAALGPKERHGARITVKKLRYASDFFVSLFPAPEATRRHEKFIAALGVLQDSLGELNDLELERRLLKHVSDPGEKRRRHRKHQRKLLRRAERGYEQLLDAGKFWSVTPTFAG
nr:CHAD domain-containing protein [Sphingomonas lycopersici]